ncbi:hypothetical protein NLI96_g11354 [Meripilus lineatus]|uniref:Uncharacterized protein n=1 Tax=Meripilus lineatus TaxID=2056292 RepID=A0AAD5UTD2_9APHY|nr:hypothetical protein NLI96_g11354 [Physisporinus lineatus]
MARIRRELDPDTRLRRPIDIKGLFFAKNANSFASVNIHTLVPQDETATVSRFPCFEHLMGTNIATQECMVRVPIGNDQYRNYLLAVQYDPTCPINQSLRAITRGVNWRGAICVLRSGRRVLATSMAGRTDQRNAIRAVRRFLVANRNLIEHATQNSRTPTFPSSLP